MKQEEQAIEILKAARKLIEKPEGWTKGILAGFRQTAPDGHVVEFKSSVFSTFANCFCAVGALDRSCQPNPPMGGAWRLSLYALEASLPERFSSIPVFNDAASTTHQDVLDLFDRAIAKLESEL